MTETSDERPPVSTLTEAAGGGDGPSLFDGEKLHLESGGARPDTVGKLWLGATRARAVETFVARPVVFGSVVTFGSCAFVLIFLGDKVDRLGTSLRMPILATVGGGVMFIVGMPYWVLLGLTLRVSRLRQLCERPEAWYFWSSAVMGFVIFCWRESGKESQRAVGAILNSTAYVVFNCLLPMADALPRKLARLFGRFACPLCALLGLVWCTTAKVAEHPWTREGNVWEWLVTSDADGRAHEARLSPQLCPCCI